MTELTSRLTDAFGPRADIADTLAETAKIARETLQKGEAFELLGLVRLHLTAEGLSGAVRDHKAVRADPMPGLLPKAMVKSDKETVVLLATEYADKRAEDIKAALIADKRRVEICEGLQGVMNAVKKYGADVLLIDTNFDMANELRQWVKTAPDRSKISVINFYTESQDPDDVRSFHICEDEILCEPFKLDEIDPLIESELERVQLEGKYFAHQVTFQFPTQDVYQQQAADYLESLVAHSGLDEPSQMGLVVAFREAVDNASRHGNKSDPNAVITVAYVLDREKVTVTIEDEGDGFDTSHYLETRISGNAIEVARARHAEGRQGGLGIMLMLKSVDKMEYNREGNAIKITKFLK